MTVIGKAIVGLAVLMSSCVPAFADSITFTFTFDNGLNSGSGIVVAETTGTAGVYLADSISGTAEGFAITGLIAPGIYPVTPGPPSDNLLYYPAVGGFFLDYNGLAFTLANSSDVNLYSSGGVNWVDTNNDNNEPNGSFDLVQVTPEPEPLVLVGTGALALLALRRRTRTTMREVADRKP